MWNAIPETWFLQLFEWFADMSAVSGIKFKKIAYERSCRRIARKGQNDQ